ncbi:hypothetical protein BUALT_Bualt01G0044600 [Buddleja alternifolia]|uniref:RING-CH-type domain-containing protein n=1 Tax=Buddleja alternifolia TaxID=168488 RepID=A0AAV6Y8I9_9LAMI|nr:hypothetical protein BUALT_Bualt01G0044600 [Buddleja alternifolia]
MSTLQNSPDVDLESANCDDGGRVSGGGGGGSSDPQVAALSDGGGNNPQVAALSGGGGGGNDPQVATLSSGGPISGDENEIVRVSDNIGNNNKKEKDERRESSVSECSVEILDLESGPHDSKINLDLAKIERDCRICHLSMDATNQDSGVPIELGCSCKDDLAAAHKQCAEAWFKIKGNKTCEICGSIAQNVSGIYETESTDLWNDETSEGTATGRTSAPVSESRNFWQGHRFLNFLLACMVFAFVISWLFHFNVPS